MCKTRYLLFSIFLLAGFYALAQETAPAKGRGNRGPAEPNTFDFAVPVHPFDLILARPEKNSVTLSVLAYQDMEGFVAFGTQSGTYPMQTPVRQFKKGEPVEVILSGLQANSQYYYQFCSRAPGSTQFTSSPSCAFHTARSPGSAFTFTITADSHLDGHTDPAVYQKTLANALADKPDFHIDLGDTFMTEKHATREAAAKQYLAQRFYFGQLCASAPLLFALGNHDGESPRGRDGEALAVWSNLMRKRHFPNPVPDPFYSGNGQPHPEAGLLQDYYAWEWGEALFIVLDPFWYTQKQRGGRDNWKRTLGSEQYQWLARTLGNSRAKFKFVFIHHLVGGADDQCRGGVEAAAFYEWGGKNPDGSDGFAQNRPGWPTPIHQLLIKNKVNAVFHGHDHFYSKQELDGIVYQEVPQPGYSGNGQAPRSAKDYGYREGTILGSSGHLRISVSADKVTVEYVRSWQPKDETPEHKNGEVAHRYSIH